MSWNFNSGWTRAVGATAILTLLSACDESGKFAMPKFPNFAKAPAAEADPTAPSTSTELIERDVEAPEVFSVTEEGLWDGRPSLGGVWVAHPDVTDPERVIIRNTSNGKFVIGALFRKERDIPGPRLQISSDAAAALGMLAGAPGSLNVTALRREEVAEPAPAPAVEAPAVESAAPVDAPAPVAESTLDPVATAAAAAINKTDAATPDTPTPAAAPAQAPAPAPAPAPLPTSKLSKPFIQLGIFSVESNAERTANVMRNAGIVPTVKKQSANGKAFWRVLVGPAQSSSERASLLKKIKAEGFSDAYAVTN